MPDSRNLLPVLLGEASAGRDQVVEHAAGLALRSGNWKYIAPGKIRDGLGPWKQWKTDEPGLLFDLAADPGETRDIASENPAKTGELAAELKRISQ